MKRTAYPLRDPLIMTFFGRDWMRDDGYCLTVLLLPAPTLRRRNEEGMMMLVGFGLRIRFVSPWGRPHWWMYVRRPGNVWRWPVLVDVHADADEIALRRAEEAGTRFPGRPVPEPRLYAPSERIPL